jgi:cytochrome c oxidase subunit II
MDDGAMKISRLAPVFALICAGCVRSADEAPRPDTGQSVPQHGEQARPVKEPAGASTWRLQEPPDDEGALEMVGRGMRWHWSFEYPNGTRSADLVVPIGRSIRLELRNDDDGEHPLHLPEVGIEETLEPGATIVLWLRADAPLETASRPSRASEGPEDAYAFGARAVPANEFAAMREGSDDGRVAGETLARFGKTLFAEKGCHACHQEGPGIGPDLRGVFGSERTFTDGTRAVADDAYVIESIVDPNARIVAGYQPVQPSFEGMLSSTQLDALVAYIRCLGDPPPDEKACEGL